MQIPEYILLEYICLIFEILWNNPMSYLLVMRSNYQNPNEGHITIKSKIDTAKIKNNGLSNALQVWFNFILKPHTYDFATNFYFMYI